MHKLQNLQNKFAKVAKNKIFINYATLSQNHCLKHNYTIIIVLNWIRCKIDIGDKYGFYWSTCNMLKYQATLEKHVF